MHFWTLKENIKDIKLLPLLKEISKKTTIEGYDFILSKRIWLSDPSVLEEIIELAKEKIVPDEFNYLKS